MYATIFVMEAATYIARINPFFLKNKKPTQISTCLTAYANSFYGATEAEALKDYYLSRANSSL